MATVLPFEFFEPQLPSYLTSRSATLARPRVAPGARYGIEEYPDLFTTVTLMTPQRNLVITPYPVEDAADVRATGELQPLSLSLRGAVAPNERRAGAVWDTCLRLQSDRELITIQSPVARYQNMIVGGLSTSHTRQTDGGLLVDMSLTQLDVGDSIIKAEVVIPEAASYFVSPAYNQVIPVETPASSLGDGERYLPTK